MTNSLPSDQTLLDPLAADHRSGFVAVVGRPNVGKSTLVNRLVGQKIAIVSPRPQTTRNRLLGILTRSDAQVIFVDTPGIHRPLHRLGEVLVETAAAALPDADAVLWLADVSVPPTDEDRQVAALLAALGPRVPVILGLNKADLLRPELVRERVAAYTALTRTIGWEMVSAARGDNLEHLLDRVVAALPPGPRLYGEDEVTDQQVRFMAGELVREQALRHLRDEVPHAVAVLVNEFKVRSEAPEQTPAGPAAPDTVRGGLTYIAATIYVERDSQRGILLGEGGQMLKKIGQGARLAIEELLETRVYLDLWVKVRPKWRADPDELRRLGYQLPKSKSGKGGTRHRKIVSVR